QLTLGGAGIQNYGSAADSTAITADTLRFEGGGTFTLATPAPASPAGTFSVDARDVRIGSNTFAVQGYQTVSVTASREVRADGSNGKLSAQHNMTVNAGRITASGNKDAAIIAGNDLTLAQVASPQTPSTQIAFGGKLNFSSGRDIDSSASIIAPSGSISLTAA